MPMPNNIHVIRFVLSVPVIFALSAGSVAQEPAGGHPDLIEVFTTTEVPVTGEATINRRSDYREIELQIFELDGIQRIEAKLSKDLSADPEHARRMALRRIQQLDEASRVRMQHAATGLAKAVQYGIDRYPAIVFNGQGVIYGLTDLDTAFQYYWVWQTRGRP